MVYYYDGRFSLLALLYVRVPSGFVTNDASPAPALGHGAATSPPAVFTISFTEGTIDAGNEAFAVPDDEDTPTLPRLRGGALCTNVSPCHGGGKAESTIACAYG